MRALLRPLLQWRRLSSPRALQLCSRQQFAPVTAASYRYVHSNLETPELPGPSTRRSEFEVTHQGPVRTQIVSESLCDDVLNYMAPSLEQYKGCDILDLNPGVGLWSSKLHDFLQPRSHVLLEGYPSIYGPYLQPLLDKPGSTYKLYKGDVSAYSTYDELVEGGVFPHQKRVTPGTPHSQELNTSLLVTGSLMWDPPMPGLGFTSLAGQLAQHFTKTSWTNQGFHAFGPVRMLLWGLHEDLKYMWPKGMHAFQKANFLIPKTTNITEIVTTGHKPRPKTRAIRRQPRYELQSLVRAMARGRESGFELPAHRRENIHDFADDIAKMTGGTGILSFVECQNYLKEQEYLGKSTENVLSDMVYDQMIREKSAAPHNKKGLAQFRSTAKRYELNRVKVDEAVDVGEAIYHQESKILGMEDGPDKDAELAKLHEMERDFEDRLGRINKNMQPSVYTELDDRIALISPVPRLPWDERPFEPLVSRPGEVWPESQVRLFDMIPRPRPDDVSLEDWEYQQDFISATTGTTGRTMTLLPQVLDSVQHGGSALIEEVPILRDPKKGGRLNMDQMRSRMLTMEMMEALIKAYREWPFRNEEARNPNYFRMREKGVRNRSRKFFRKLGKTE